MFFRVKPAGTYRYLQIAHSVREGKKVRQQVKSHPGPARPAPTEWPTGSADALRPTPLRGPSRPGRPGRRPDGAGVGPSDRARPGVWPPLATERLTGRLARLAQSASLWL